jgi:pyridoxal phosphate enzyme (YggS family)
MNVDSQAIRARLQSVRERIARAAGRAGRDASSVRLVAVSKTWSVDQVRAAAEAGQSDFAENKVQEALPKIAETAGMELTWHLVGHLQSNKARKAAAAFDMIHSVDAPAIVARLGEAARATGRHLDLLVQVDLAGEPTKHGAPPDAVQAVIASAQEYPGVAVRGLMLIPPFVEDPEGVRPYFAALRSLRDDLVVRGVDSFALAELSMGMSHDFEVAIEEGATIVRVGTAIFGERTHV